MACNKHKILQAQELLSFFIVMARRSANLGSEEIVSSNGQKVESQNTSGQHLMLKTDRYLFIVVSTLS